MTNALDRYFSLKHDLQMLCFYNLLVNSFKGSCCQRCGTVTFIQSLFQFTCWKVGDGIYYYYYNYCFAVYLFLSFYIFVFYLIPLTGKYTI